MVIEVLKQTFQKIFSHGPVVRKKITSRVRILYAFNRRLLMTTMDISLNQVDEQMKRLQEIKAFLEGVRLPRQSRQADPRVDRGVEAQEINLIIHEYWNQ